MSAFRNKNRVIAPEDEQSRRVLAEESEIKPNRYAGIVLAGVAAVIIIVCLLNETGVFHVDRSLIHSCLFVSLIQLVAVTCILRSRHWIALPTSKFIIMAMVFVQVLVVTTLLNIHTVLAYVLPILMATQYRSHRISLMALLGAILCCGTAPVLSWLLGTWSEVFITGFVETFLRVTVTLTPGNSLTPVKSVWQILLFWSLPQMLTLGAFGAFLYSATKNGIAGIRDSLRAIKLTRDLAQQLESVNTMQERMLFAMSDIIESRDLETGGHVRRTSRIVQLLTDAMRADPDSGIRTDFCTAVINSAPMHDLGKIAIPDAILRKPDRLTQEEYEIVKTHPLKSAEIIRQALTGVEDERLLDTAVNMAKYHHERYDGEGYPEGLAGEDIPLEARIMAIADVYDALVNERCYKAPMDCEEAFAAVMEAMGSQFDPALGKYFVACRAEIEDFYHG